VLQRFGSSYNIKVGYQRPLSVWEAIIAAIRNLVGAFVEIVRSLLGVPGSPARLPDARAPELGGRQEGTGIGPRLSRWPRSSWVRSTSGPRSRWCG
jgi:hypothetical protein